MKVFSATREKMMVFEEEEVGIQSAYTTREFRGFCRGREYRCKTLLFNLLLLNNFIEINSPKSSHIVFVSYFYYRSFAVYVNL